MVVKELGQLLTHAFFALALVAEKDGPLEQRLLQFLRQMAPKIRGGRAEDDEITVRIDSVRRAIRCFAHEEPDRCRAGGRTQNDCRQND
jgi:hypothetical protein